MDPDISKLVRNTQKESKYYKKFGMKTPEELEAEQLEKQKIMYATKADSVFKKKPDSKGGEDGSGTINVPKTDLSNGTKKTDAPPVDLKKNAAMSNMFGENTSKKEPEPAKQQVPPPPPANKETNINALFGTGPGQKIDPVAAKSPGTKK